MFHHNKQINIAILGSHAPGIGAKQNDFFEIKLLRYLTYELINFFQRDHARMVSNIGDRVNRAYDVSRTFHGGLSTGSGGWM